MIEATFTINEKEYAEAQREYSRTVFPASAWIRYVLVVVFVIFIIAVAVTTRKFDPTLIACGFYLVFLVSFPLLRKHRLRKRYQVEAVSLTNVHVEIDELGFRTQVPTQGRSDLEWSAFTSYCETPNVLILIMGLTFHPILKMAFTETEVHDLMSLVKARLPKLTRKLAKAQGR